MSDEKEIKYITECQLYDILHSEISLRNRMIIRIAVSTGLSAIDISNLKIGDILDNGKVIRASISNPLITNSGKGVLYLDRSHKKDIYIPIFSDVLEHTLADLIKDRELQLPLIDSNKNQSMSASNICRMYKNVSLKVGLIHPYTQFRILHNTYFVYTANWCKRVGLTYGTYYDFIQNGWYDDIKKKEKIDSLRGC